MIFVTVHEAQVMRVLRILHVSMDFARRLP
jgi:plasmid stabilization system protein ParE